MGASPATAQPPLRIGGRAAPRVWLAPMTGISDLAFRRVAGRLGAAYAPTEMVASAELARGRPDVVRRAEQDGDAPLKVMQLIGREPQWMAEGARLAQAAGAEIIDLNFGCPAREVTGVLSGSALLRDLDLAERLVAAAAEAVTLPVTVKTRLGWDDSRHQAPEFAVRAERAGAQAITIHGRTRCQFYAGAADWAAVAAVKQAVRMPVAVNGDIVDLVSARAALAASGADAVMVGRGAVGQPWLAQMLERGLAGESSTEPTTDERLAIVLEHLAESLRLYGERLGLRVFRKHLAAYVDGGPAPLDPAERRAARGRLCRLETAGEVEAALRALWLGPAAMAEAA